ncbi:hypothetical protein [Pseudomonas sp. RW10S2]|uniref:hypothetical protein n=1 Tax=Pseudomonas sp. RW10S2 TaxID=459637 RepID=UPI0016457FF8|nr:hypothetical protein [Pseudomonas sp. RW10S2]MBC3464224.1 hypothetical protein [Pseudomonas sp. RW10S2]QXI44970.1 hypothetical protein HU734_009445 [Pseudomonas wayambapalatensis]
MSTAEDEQQLHAQGLVSKPLTFKVTRRAETDYPAPSVLQATDDRLDPIDALNGATVRAQYPAMLPSDTLAADWSGSTATDSWQSDQQPGSLFGYVDFQAPVSVVAASQGKTVTLRYAVARSGQAARLSLPMLLAVGTLAQSDLPAPVIPQANATTRVLDLNNFTGNAQVKVEPWPLIAVGQRVWIRVDGTLENGSAHTVYLARGEEVVPEQVTAGLDLVLPRTELEKLSSGSSLTATVSVAFDATSNEGQARVFPNALYTLEKIIVVRPTIVSVKDDKGTEVPNGSSTTSPSLVLSGQASANQQVEVLDGASVISTEPVAANGSWTSTRTNLSVKTYDFKVRGRYADNPESDVWTVHRVQELVLAKPVIPLAPGDVLPPGDVPSTGLPVLVEVYGGMAIGDVVSVTFAGIAGSPQTVGSVSRLTFSVPKTQVDANAGRTVTVQYLVTRGSGGAAVPSPVVNLRINALTPPLTIDTSPATLNGVIHRNSNPVTHPPANAFVQRTASGGQPPYTYSTSNGNVIEVNPSTGRAVSYGSGTANVIVTDTAGASASYPVTVSNVRRIEGMGSVNVWYWCRDLATERGGALPTLGEWDAMRASYNNNPGIGDRAWSADSAGTGRRYAIDVANGNRVSLRATNFGGDTAVGWGIFNR